jgi:hypothetical protein
MFPLPVLRLFKMRLIEWEVAEDGYEEQIIISKGEEGACCRRGHSTENKQKVTVRIMNLSNCSRVQGSKVQSLTKI